jgi:hypothetical protein
MKRAGDGYATVKYDAYSRCDNRSVLRRAENMAENLEFDPRREPHQPTPRSEVDVDVVGIVR